MSERGEELGLIGIGQVHSLVSKFLLLNTSLSPRNSHNI